MKPIKAVFFDNDGILVDTEPIWVQANLEMFHQLGFPVTKDWYLDYNLTQGKGLVNFLPEHGFSDKEIHNFCTKRTERYWDLLPKVQPMSGVMELIEKLKAKGIMIGIVTAALRRDFEKVHAESDWLGLFDFIVVNDDTPNTKPHADPYLLALEKSGFRADEVLVIEDSPRGVIAARAAGIEKVIAVPTDITRNGDFSGAWRVETDITNVLQLFTDLS